MTDPEHDLATILAALSSTEPPPGLNRRILENLANRQPAATRSGRRPPRLLRVPRPLRIAAALPLAAALVLALASLHSHRHAAPATLSSAVPRPTPSVAASLPPIPSCCPSQQGRDSLQFASSHREPRRAKPSATAPPPELASFPAPPLPLTPQEKLLLRVAHARNPQQSPALNPALRASLAARDDESFQIFFASATTIKPYESPN